MRKPGIVPPKTGISLKLPETLQAKLHGIATDSGRSISGIVREALQMGLEDMEKDPARALATRRKMLAAD
jgi:predicted DNA-binding protein